MGVHRVSRRKEPDMADKPFVPVEHRLALTVPEAAALCGIPGLFTEETEE